MCYLNSGRAIDAEKIYQKLLRKESTRSNQDSSPFEGFALQEQADIYWALAKIQFERDHTLEALKSLDQAISIGLKNPDGQHSSYVAHITVEMLNRKITMLEELGDSEKMKEVEKIHDEYLKNHNPFFDFTNDRNYLGEYTRAQIQNEALEATRVLLERKSTYYWEEINILEKQHASAKGVESMRQSGLLPSNSAELSLRRERLVSNLTYDQMLIRKIGEPRKVNDDTVSCEVAAELWSTKKKENVPCRLRYTFSLDPKSLSVKISGVQILNQFKWTS
jgi:tetratricopeptide (TPR) repeat protein